MAVTVAGVIPGSVAKVAADTRFKSQARERTAMIRARDRTCAAGTAAEMGTTSPGVVCVPAASAGGALAIWTEKTRYGR